MTERIYTPRTTDRDIHHPFFPRAYHRKTYKEAAYIANTIVVPDMWRPIHDALHTEVSGVPALGYYALCSVARNLDPPYDNPIQAIDHYSSLVERAAAHPKVKPREAELDLLHVATLRDQLPFIRDSLKHNRRQR